MTAGTSTMIRFFWDSCVSVQFQDGAPNPSALGRPDPKYSLQQFGVEEGLAHSNMRLKLYLIIMIVDNPFQRETQHLRLKSNQQLFEKLYMLVRSSNTKNIEEGIDVINQIQGLLQQQQENDNETLKNQIRFLKAIYQQLLHKPQISQNICKQILQKNQDISEYFPIRISVLGICSKIRQEVAINQQQVDRLLGCLENQPQHKNQVLFKLTGAKSVGRMRDVSFEEIQELTSSVYKRALKFGIVGDWKYFIGDSQTAIRMKTQAIRLYTLQNNKQKASKAQIQQKIIINLTSESDQKTIVQQNMIFLRQIIQRIQMLQDINMIEAQRMDKKKNAMRFMIGQSIKVIQKQIETNKQVSFFKTKKSEMKKSQLKNSGLKKQQKIVQKIERGKEFLNQSKKNNFFCIDFVPVSKFSAEMERSFAQKMGIFNKLVKKQYRHFTNNIKKITEIQKLKQSS